MNSNINDRIYEIAQTKQIYGQSWQDIADVINSEFDTCLSADACRKRYAAHNISKIIESEICDDCTDTETSKLDLLTQVRDERTQANALFRRMSRENTLITLAKEAAANMTNWVPVSSSEQIYTSRKNNEALLMISDWHYGIEIDNFFNKYNVEICKHRVNELANNVINKIKENEISKLHVLNLGDMIAGLIHLQLRINSRLDVISQTMQVAEIISEFLFELSKYANIEYYQVLDNHSRLDPNKKEAMQLESLARIIPWFAEARLQSFPKKYHTIHFNENEFDQDIATFYIHGEYLVAGVHGDDDKQSTMINKLKAFLKDNIDLICSAHLHHPSFDTDNRTTRISNGSLMGTDEFAVKHRLDSFPSQTLLTFKEVENFGIDIDSIYILNNYISS